MRAADAADAPAAAPRRGHCGSQRGHGAVTAWSRCGHGAVTARSRRVTARSRYLGQEALHEVGQREEPAARQSSTHTHTHARTHTHMHARTHTRARAHTHTPHTHTLTHAHAHAHARTRTHAYTYARTHAHSNTRVSVRAPNTATSTHKHTRSRAGVSAHAPTHEPPSERVQRSNVWLDGQTFGWMVKPLAGWSNVWLDGQTFDLMVRYLAGRTLDRAVKRSPAPARPPLAAGRCRGPGGAGCKHGS